MSKATDLQKDKIQNHGTKDCKISDNRMKQHNIVPASKQFNKVKTVFLGRLNDLNSAVYHLLRIFVLSCQAQH